MEKLKQELHSLISQLSNRDIFYQRLRNLVSVYPLNEYEFMIASLFAQNILTYDSYIELRDEYISRNMFLYIFEISASRGFGEAWAQGHLKELAPQLEKPTKKKDPHYSGEYDFLLDRTIKIEAKASRAVDFESDEPLPLKALSSDSDRRFDMNFQQIKPRCCDVFHLGRRLARPYSLLDPKFRGIRGKSLLFYRTASRQSGGRTVTSKKGKYNGIFTI